MYYCSIATFYNVYSMDVPFVRDYNLNSLSYIVGEQNKRDLAWEIILKHGIALFDYTMVRSLAVNKVMDEILRRTTEMRKKYVEMHAFLVDNSVHYCEWSGYGAVNGNIVIESTGKSVKTLWIEQQNLVDPMLSPRFGITENFYAILPHQPRPFFNLQGDFCFYGYGEITNVSNQKSGTVVEYSLSAYNVVKIRECVTFVKNRFFTLRLFLEFPLLLQAFLNSCQVYQLKIGRDKIVVEVFDFKGVIIPKNYTFHKKYFPDKEYESFDDLPKVLRKKIVSLYTKQKRKKHKEVLSALFAK